jgi:hypothetical protein
MANHRGANDGFQIIFNKHTVPPEQAETHSNFDLLTRPGGAECL